MSARLRGGPIRACNLQLRPSAGGRAMTIGDDQLMICSADVVFQKFFQGCATEVGGREEGQAQPWLSSAEAGWYF
eukprot:15468916-Alexandrium_andersonii.AAC.1